MTLLHFAQHYTVPRQGGDPKSRTKKVVVIVRPHLSLDPGSRDYEQYCKQKLMLHRPFRDEQQLLDIFSIFAESYTNYLQTGNIPTCLQDDIHRL